jgi:hypothetical protein
LACTACGISPTPEAWVLTAPAISVQIMKGYCPSIEVQPGMQISWTNQDDQERLLILQRVDDQGVITDSGGTNSLPPGGSFSIVLTEAGEYTYFCSLDRTEFGVIHVVADASIPVTPTQSAKTPQCVETIIPPVITEIQPPQPLAGGEMTVMATGGYIQDSCGGVNESSRSFPLYLDNEPVTDLQCYINHCEAKIQLVETLTSGTHCLSTQKEGCELEFQVVK